MRWSTVQIFCVAASLLVVSNSAVFAQCDSSKEMMSGLENRATIVETAASLDDFSTLVAAVKAAELVSLLGGEGPYTVFAPTNDAFAKLPKGTVASLLLPENRSALQRVLSYHVVPGNVMAKDVINLTSADTLSGQRLDISTADASVSIDSARVIKTDVRCSNGVIHVIDTVLLPSQKNIVETAKDAGSFGTLLAAAQAAGLASALTAEGPLTVFAPTDAAFAALPKGTVETLLLPENRDQLVAILKLHVVPGRVFAKEAIDRGRANTLNGESLTVRSDGNQVQVNGSSVISADIDCSNGVVHVIDTVLLPKQ